MIYFGNFRILCNDTQYKQTKMKVQLNGPLNECRITAREIPESPSVRSVSLKSTEILLERCKIRIFHKLTSKLGL